MRPLKFQALSAGHAAGCGNESPGEKGQKQHYTAHKTIHLYMSKASVMPRFRIFHRTATSTTLGGVLGLRRLIQKSRSGA